MSKLSDIQPQVDAILVVEDDDDIRESLKAVLEARFAGSKVTTAEGGKQGLAALDEQEFDAIISDFKMPEMDGLEFLAAARKKQPEVPRILVTAYPEINVAMEAINDAAISNFLTKPVSPETLIEAVNAAVVKSRRNQAWTRAFDGAGKVPLGSME